MRGWLRVTQTMAIGYSAMSRTFAYIGIIPAKIFISEIVLGWFLIARSRALSWFFGGVKRSKYVDQLRAALIIFLGYGAVSLMLGIVKMPGNAFAAFQNLAFNYYSLYLIIGVWVAANTRLNMREFGSLLGWIHGIYGTLWILILNRFENEIPGTSGVMWFGQPTGAAIAILTMIAFEPQIKRLIIPIMLNLFVMLGVQVRSEWFGFIVAFTVWSFLARKMSRFFMIIFTVGTLMCAGYMFDVKLEGANNRGGEISVRGIIGRMFASFDADLASKYVDNAEDLKGTGEWRKNWWAAIWQKINRGDATELFFGEGYGFPITDVVNFVEDGIRTPHNIFFYALCYGGWVGVGVFVFFQGTLLWCLFRVYRLTGRAFGVALWIQGVTMALLGNQFETPFGAIPFYLLIGMSLKPLFVRREFWEESPRRRARFTRPVFTPQQQPTYPMPAGAGAAHWRTQPPQVRR